MPCGNKAFLFWGFEIYYIEATVANKAKAIDEQRLPIPISLRRPLLLLSPVMATFPANRKKIAHKL